MIALIFSIIIIIGIASQFYLKYAPVKSFTSMMSALLGFIVAFSYYETLAGIFINKGYIPQWAQSIAFMVLFLVTSVALYSLADLIVGSNINFNPLTKTITAVVCGLVTGVFISGAVIIGFTLAPLGRSNPYARFGEPVNLNNPKSAAIPADSIITGLYSLVSKGSLSSKTKFDVVHAEYLDQLHLNRYNAKDPGIATVAGKNAAFVNKYGVTKVDRDDGSELTVVELNIKNNKIEDGGAMDSENNVSMAKCQVRLICSKDASGQLSGDNVEVLYPVDYHLEKNKDKKESSLTTEIVFGSEDFENKAATIPLAFEVSGNLTPRLLEFKANVLIELPKAVTEEEKKAALEEEKRKKEANADSE